MDSNNPFIVGVLTNLITTGVFASKAHAYIDCTIRRGENTFYATTKAAHGLEAAECKLAEWDARLHYSDFAACIEPTARSILALAKTGCVVDITSYKSRMSSSLQASQPRNKFVVFNSQVPRYDYNQLDRNDMFSPYGQLGLKAVILEAGFGYHGVTAELSLALNAWGTEQQPPQPGEFVVVTIDSNGMSRGERYRLFTKNLGDFEASPSWNVVLKDALGAWPHNERLSGTQDRGGIADVIGFPGAEALLAAELPHLCEYLTSLARQLGPSTH